MIVDSHQHLWDLSRHRHAWCADLPALHRSFLMADYLAATADLPAGLSIAQTVHVEADVDAPLMAAETRWVLSLAEAPDNPLAGVVAACRPEYPAREFRAALEPFAGHPRLKGVRRVLHDQPDDRLRSRPFVENVRALAEYGLTFDLGVLARQLPLAVDLVRACPEVSFVLDHCGAPDVKGRALDPWRAHVKQLANLPNLAACKISGLVTCADPEHWTAADLRPFVEHALECFGPDRVMFGSDWPVCTLASTPARWVEALLELTAAAAPDERDRLFRRNAQRVYRLA